MSEFTQYISTLSQHLDREIISQDRTVILNWAARNDEAWWRREKVRQLSEGLAYKPSEPEPENFPLTNRADMGNP